jgi:hypothetical protein
MATRRVFGGKELPPERMAYMEKFCHKCRHVVVSGVCIACGLFVGSGTTNPTTHVPFEPAVTAPAVVSPDNPHVPEQSFNLRLSTVEYGSGTISATQDEGGAVDVLSVVRT